MERQPSVENKQSERLSQGAMSEALLAATPVTEQSGKL
jgi:hypothetical protein